MKYILKYNNIHSEYIYSDKIIKTNSQFGNAFPDFEETSKNIPLLLTLFESTNIILITGFIGSDKNNRITTYMHINVSTQCLQC